jgi:hypothetical protein
VDADGCGIMMISNYILASTWYLPHPSQRHPWKGRCKVDLYATHTNCTQYRDWPNLKGGITFTMSRIDAPQRWEEEGYWVPVLPIDPDLAMDEGL